MIPPLLYLDRYRNEGTRSYSEHSGYSEAREEYRPNGGHSAFEAAAYELPRDRMNVYTADPPEELEATYLPGDSVVFCIHPQLLDEQADEAYVQRTLRLGEPRTPILVSPSSSTRTLHVLAHGRPHALKVHFPFRVSRYGRRMRDEVVEQAITVSAELEDWRDMEEARFAFLREVIGITHKNLRASSPRGENWGYLVRDLVPFPDAPEDRTLIPGFALYGRDFFDPGKGPLLLELMGSHDPVDWMLGNILLPIIRHWVACFRTFGFILEPHGQNVLLEIEPEGSVTRIVHRDLSVGIDMRRRGDLGLPDGELNAYNRMEDGAFNSIAYDKFMGGHFFDPLVGVLLETMPRLTLEDFRGPCRDEFARIFPEQERYLPRTVQYFSEERDRFGKPLNHDTGAAPTWRP